MLAPLAEQAKGRAIIAVCDVSRNPEIAARERVLAGMMVVYRDGREVARSMGGEATAEFAAALRDAGMIVR